MCGSRRRGRESACGLRARTALDGGDPGWNLEVNVQVNSPRSSSEFAAPSWVMDAFEVWPDAIVGGVEWWLQDTNDVISSRYLQDQHGLFHVPKVGNHTP